MDWLTFVASLAGSLAWPIAVAIVAIIFRGQIRILLARPVHRAKAGPVEVEWEQRVEEARVELAASPEAAEGPPPAAETGLRERLGTLAEQAPRGAILEAFAGVEQTLRRMVDDAGLERSPGSMRDLVDSSVFFGVISEQTAHAIRGLIVLRNLAAHGGAEEIDAARAEEFVALAEGVLYALEAARRRRGEETSDA